MEKIQCPKCKELTTLDISKAVDEEGEVFKCEYCGYHFRYVNE